MSQYEILKKDTLSEIESILYELDVKIENNKQSFVSDYKSQALLLLDNLHKLQNLPGNQQDNGQQDERKGGQSDATVGKIGTLLFALSRINIDNGLLSYKVKVYGSKIYEDCYDFEQLFDVSNVFSYLEKARENLMVNRSKYLGIIEPCNINAEINQYIPYFNMYAVNLLKEVFDDPEVQKSVKQLATYKDFFAVQNEIYEKPFQLFYSSNSDTHNNESRQHKGGEENEGSYEYELRNASLILARAMGYYLVEFDNDINTPIDLNDYFNQPDASTDVVIKSNITEKTKLVDYTRPVGYHISYHVFSDKVKAVIEGYNSNVDFHGVFATSLDMKQQHVYWRIDALGLKSITVEDADDIRKAELLIDEIGNNTIFCITKSRHEYIVVREDLAEGILRRCPIGIKLTKLAAQ